MLVGQLWHGQWCGRTVSPFPNAHTTKKLIDPHVGRRSHHDPPILPFFHSRKELGEPFLIIHDFPCVWPYLHEFVVWSFQSRFWALDVFSSSSEIHEVSLSNGWKLLWVNFRFCDFVLYIYLHVVVLGMRISPSRRWHFPSSRSWEIVVVFPWVWVVVELFWPC